MKIFQITTWPHVGYVINESCGLKEGRIKWFILPRDLGRTLDKTVMWHYEWKQVIVSQNLAKISGHRHCGSGYILVLVCHVIVQDHMIKRLFELMGRDRAPHDKSPPYRVCWSWKLGQWIYNGFRLPRDLAGPHDPKRRLT